MKSSLVEFKTTSDSSSGNPMEPFNARSQSRVDVSLEVEIAALAVTSLAVADVYGGTVVCDDVLTVAVQQLATVALDESS